MLVIRFIRVFGKSPCGRSTSTTRNTMCPNHMPQPGSSPKPICCVMPRIIAPASVPQKEPMPPMITASKANSSSSGPS